MAIGHVIIQSVEGWQQGIAAHGGESFGDIPNYTDITPLLQFSEVVA